MFDAQTREARDGVRDMRRPYRRYGAASYPDAGAARDLLLRRLGALVPADGSLADELPHAITDVHSTPHRQAVIEPAGRSRIWVLVDGWLLRAVYLHDGACQITEILVPGDLSTGFTSDGDPASVLVACGAVRIAMLDLDALSPPARTMMEHALHMARREEVRRLHTRLVTIGRRNARARLAQFMAETYARLAAVGLAEDGCFECPLTQEQLGDSLGLTPVHVNRTLRRLYEEGVMAMSRRRIEIFNLAQLECA